MHLGSTTVVPLWKRHDSCLLFSKGCTVVYRTAQKSALYCENGPRECAKKFHSFCFCGLGCSRNLFNPSFCKYIAFLQNLFNMRSQGYFAFTLHQSDLEHTLLKCSVCVCAFACVTVHNWIQQRRGMIICAQVFVLSLKSGHMIEYSYLMVIVRNLKSKCD